MAPRIREGDQGAEKKGESEPEALATVGKYVKGKFTSEGFCKTVAYASGSDSYFRAK